MCIVVMNRKITVNVDDETWERIAHLAADEDTLSDIVREVIRVGLKKKERRMRRGSGH